MSKNQTVERFDCDYFENGIVSGKSCYENYRWLPELTIRMAHRMIKYLGMPDGASVLDFGCAKGYMVRALRILDMEAFGCDVSRYAVGNADPEVRAYCRVCHPANGRMIPFDRRFQWIVSKDVLEHLDESALMGFLDEAREHTDRMFHVIPLADENGVFVVPEYERDITHSLRKSSEWWRAHFEERGWKCVRFALAVPGVKDNWTARYPKGNGFFVFQRVAKRARRKVLVTGRA